MERLDTDTNIRNHELLQRLLFVCSISVEPRLIISSVLFSLSVCVSLLLNSIKELPTTHLRNYEAAAVQLILSCFLCVGLWLVLIFAISCDSTTPES